MPTMGPRGPPLRRRRRSRNGAPAPKSSRMVATMRRPRCSRAGRRRYLPVGGAGGQSQGRSGRQGGRQSRRFAGAAPTSGARSQLRGAGSGSCRTASAPIAATTGHRIGWEAHPRNTGHRSHRAAVAAPSKRTARRDPRGGRLHRQRQVGRVGEIWGGADTQGGHTRTRARMPSNAASGSQAHRARVPLPALRSGGLATRPGRVAGHATAAPSVRRHPVRQ